MADDKEMKIQVTDEFLDFLNSLDEKHKAKVLAAVEKMKTDRTGAVEMGNGMFYIDIPGDEPTNNADEKQDKDKPEKGAGEDPDTATDRPAQS